MEFDGAVAPDQCSISRPVQSCAGPSPEGVGNEQAGGPFRIVEIAAAQRLAPDIHFAGHVKRHRLEVPVEDVHRPARQRPSDRNRMKGKFFH